MTFNDVPIVYVKGSAYTFHFWYRSKNYGSSITKSRHTI